MKKYIILTATLIAMVLIWPSCNQVEEEGSIQFGLELSDDTALKSANSDQNITPDQSITPDQRISAALVTIKDRNGKLIYDKEYLEVFKFGEQFTTRSLNIPVGNFQLTEFMLIDSSGTVLWATPVEGSILAHLVRDPLPIPFDVNADQTTSLSVQVVRVGDHPPADFGYVNFNIGFVDRFCLQVFYSSHCMEEWNDSILGPQGSGAPIHQPRLIIMTGDRVVVDEALNQGLNRYLVPLVDRWYVITATDCHGDMIYMKKFPAMELMEHRCGDQFKPLVIYRDAPEVIITPEGLLEPTIKQGIYGNITVPVDDSTLMEKYEVYPVVRDLYILPYEVMDSLISFAPVDCYFPLEMIGVDPLAVVRSNSGGFFQIPLEPGEYLYLVKEGDRYYIDSYISSHRPGQVVVRHEELTELLIHVIDCSMWM
ncbi:MAG: hypothetical protein ABFS28_16000 [Bacteroidota bacterium]